MVTTKNEGGSYKLFKSISMRPIAVNVYVLFMFLAYVMRRAGTFSMEEKVKMIEFLSYMALNPNIPLMGATTLDLSP
tara:strand:+ start:54 stop:284 length:231 start_codon:yes stop_codon:yes gene_type:complete